MSISNIFPVVFISATLLCTLVAGFILLFAIVVMPGIGSLSDREFLRAFQVIDRVIQNNQPIFLFVWIGSALALTAASILSFWELEGINRVLVITATVAYLLGVQLPTIAINIPLNNRLQALDLVNDDEVDHAIERRNFETRWNRWNSIRTIFACTISVLLLSILNSPRTGELLLFHFEF